MFGVLRKFADDQGHYPLSLTDTLSVHELKILLKNSLSEKFNNFDPKMIDESAVANRSEILNLDSRIHPNDEIAILPPVCGG